MKSKLEVIAEIKSLLPRPSKNIHFNKPIKNGINTYYSIMQGGNNLSYTEFCKFKICSIIDASPYVLETILASLKNNEFIAGNFLYRGQ